MTGSVNSVAVIAKPVTAEIVSEWLSVKDMSSVLAIGELENGCVSNNSIKYDRICFDISCREVAGIILIEETDGEQCFRYSQFPVNAGTWCEIDGKYCLDPCFDVIDDTCVEEEEILKPHPMCKDWCAEWQRLQCILDEQLVPAFKTQFSAFGRSASFQRLSDRQCDKLEARIREAKNKCLRCQGFRNAANGLFRRISDGSFKR